MRPGTRWTSPRSRVAADGEVTPLTARRLNRATLDRQLLLRRARVDVVEAVRRIVAIQAQEPASPYVALWNRVEAFDPADLDAAFATHAVVKSTLMRMTLHVVAVEDYPDLHEAMRATLRADRVGDPRFRLDGLTAAEVRSLEATLVAAAKRPRTGRELEAALAGRVADPATAWWGLRSFAPLVHAPTGGPWSFTSRAFVAPPVRRRAAGRRSLGRLVRRYLEGFGPAGVADIAQFARIRRADVRNALPDAGPLVERIGPDGSVLLDTADAPPIPEADTPAPARLLPMWDSILLAYDDRSRIIPPDLRPSVIRTNGDVLPTLLVDGLVAGVWRPVDGGIEATALRPIDEAAWEELGREAAGLVRFLADRQPAAYARYRRWWTRLPEAAEVRVLPG